MVTRIKQKSSRIQAQPSSKGRVAEDTDYVGDEENDGYEDDLDDVDTPFEDELGDDEDFGEDLDFDADDIGGDSDPDEDEGGDEDADDFGGDDGLDVGDLGLDDEDYGDGSDEDYDDEDDFGGDDEDEDFGGGDEDEGEGGEDEGDEDEGDEEDYTESLQRKISLRDLQEEVSDLGDKSSKLLKKLDDKTVSPALAKEMLSTLVGYLGGAMELYADLEKYAAKSDYENKDLVPVPYKA